MSEYKPGIVAMATVRGVAGIRVIRTCDHPDGGKGWVSATSVAAHYTHHDHNVTDIRPLAVLDPEDEAVAKFVRMHPEGDPAKTATYVFGQQVARLIEAQTKPPRIPEPGLWGVVEAHTDLNRERRQFGRGPDADGSRMRWIDSADDDWRYWDELIDPTLIREGVES